MDFSGSVSILFTFMFVFVDNEPPSLVCPDNQSVQTDQGKSTVVVEWDEANVSDNSGTVAHVSCNQQSGTNFSIGETVVTCKAVDKSRNRAECSFQVNVTGNYSYIV